MGGKRRFPKIHLLKNWQLFIILVPLLFLDAMFLRNDHIKMVELRDAVLAADAAEDEEGLKTSLAELKNFTLTHTVINIVDDNGRQKITFGTGPFYLERQYTRAALDALFEAENSFVSDDNPNGNIYGEASTICKNRAIQNGWRWDNPNFINCMLEEIAKYPSASEIKDSISAAIPSTELYRRNYASPIWTPTLSGFAILATLLIIVVIFIRIIVWIILKIALRFV